MENIAIVFMIAPCDGHTFRNTGRNTGIIQGFEKLY